MNADGKALKAVYAAIDDLNRQRAADDHLKQSPETALVGEAGQLDSLALVTFVVALEQKVEDIMGVRLSLTEVLLSSDETPFASVGSLAEYIERETEGSG